MRVIYESRGRSAAPALGWKERAVLTWGKLRRFYLLTFRPVYVEESLKRRVGACQRTGSCCKLAFTCPWLRLLEYLPFCSHYARRPRNCMTFPIDERDIRDRDIVSPHDPCGYSFLSPEQAREREEKQRQVEFVVQV
jgi:hypothetical protein